MNISILLALKFLRNSKTDNNISAMIKICFISILIGTFAFSLIAAIMNGFEKATHQKLQGIHSDIIIQAQGKELDFNKIKNLIDTKFKDSIENISPSSSWQVIVQTTNQPATNIINNLVMLKAVDPLSETQVNNLKNTLIETLAQNSNWSELLINKNVFIGQALANQLNIKIGDKLDILYGDEIKNNKIILNKQEVLVTGIFKTGINEYDEHVIICSLDFFEDLFQKGITEVSAKLKNKSQEQTIISQLKKDLNLDVFSWKDLYPALVSALALEKYAMLTILALVTLVACMNIVSLLYMFITNKKREIVILKSMGMPQKKISTTFIILGMSITLLASTIGIAFASFASWVLNKYPFITLPDAYYVTHLPSEMDWQLILIIFTIIIILSFISSALPANRTKFINVTNVLKMN